MTSAGFSDGRPVWIPLESNPEAFNKVSPFIYFIIKIYLFLVY